MRVTQRSQQVIGAGSAIGGAALLSSSSLAWTETAFGPAQDLSQSGAGDPARITTSISLVVWAFAGFAIALLSLDSRLRRTGDPRWPIVPLGIAATLSALCGVMIVFGWSVGWWPGILLGVLNLPALLLLVAGWIGMGLMSRRAYGSNARGILPLGQLVLAFGLFVFTAVGGPILMVVELWFVVGWIAIAWLIWSGNSYQAPVLSP